MEYRLTNLLDQHDFNLIIASTFNSIPYVQKIKHIPLMLEEHNFTTKWLKERYMNSETTIRKLTKWISWKKCKNYENKVYPHFKLVTMVSETDKQAVRDELPRYKGRLEVVPNGVDLRSRKFRSITPEINTLIFNGSLTYAANLDAMKFFKKEIWHLIQLKIPEAKLTITGNIQGVDLSWLDGDSKIHLTGYLDDVVKVINRNWICVVPIRDGSGTRLKILEAMALGVPVVTTSKGVEGINAVNGIHVLVADDPARFADACIQLLTNPSLHGSLAIQARHLVENEYGWEEIAGNFVKLVESCTE